MGMGDEWGMGMGVEGFVMVGREVRDVSGDGGGERGGGREGVWVGRWID